MAGKDIGGTGFGLGFDRTLEALETLGLVPNVSANSAVLGTVFSPEIQKQSLGVAAQLRKQKISVDLYPAPDKLEKQLKYADRKGIPYVVIQGPEEISRGAVKLKDMKSQMQEEMTIEQVTKKLISN